MFASALLDLSEAFDSISHHLLLAKLKSFNIDESAINSRESCLKNRSQKVVLQNVSSDWIGLYQGTILGPLLFNLYVNGMINTIFKPCELVHNADDTFLFVANENIEEAICHLEVNISKLVDFFQCPCLNLNKTKTEFKNFCKKA